MAEHLLGPKEHAAAAVSFCKAMSGVQLLRDERNIPIAEGDVQLRKLSIKRHGMVVRSIAKASSF